MEQTEAKMLESGENKENQPSGTEQINSNIQRDTSEQPLQKLKKGHRMFLDDTEYTSFVRRLAWSPDGTFMLTPGSWYHDLAS